MAAFREHRKRFAHDPANAERRSRSASKAARSKPKRELMALKDQLRTVADGVLSGTVEPKRAGLWPCKR